MSIPPDLPERFVYIVSIDIKDGWYDIIHAFTSQEAADDYLAWEQKYVGDHAYITEVPLDDAWIAPPDRPQPTEPIQDAAL